MKFHSKGWQLLQETTLIVLILALAMLVRWYKIDNPIADWHSWRQADTASVTRHFVKDGINLLVPTFDDLSSVTTGIDNPKGYRMVEFPLYNAIHAIFAKSFTFWSLEKWGRIISSIYSLISIVFFYLILKRLSGKLTATFGAILLALMPFNIYYSRVVLPEPLMIALELGSLYFFLRWIDESKTPKVSGNSLVSAILFALTLLVKPYAVFFILPQVFFAISRFGKKIFTSWAIWIYIAIALAPFAAWRLWIRQFPEGIPGSSWLFNYRGIRFRPAWFRWLFGVRLGQLILGYWGLIPFGIGLLMKPTKRENWFYQLWFLGVIIYFSVLAGGNVTHDYYQAITVPMVAALVAKGLSSLFSGRTNFTWPIAPIVGFFCFGLMVFLSFYEIQGYYNVNNWSIVHAGIEANKVIPPNAKVVAPYQGDTAFLYQTNREGWPIIEGDIKTMVDKLGANYYVSVNYDADTKKIMGEGEYKVLEQTPEFVIVKLRDQK